MKAVATEKEALAYLLECSLATVAKMAIQKRRPKGEFERQKRIAEQTYLYCKQFNVDISRTRGQEVDAFSGGDVHRWAEKFMPEHQRSRT